MDKRNFSNKNICIPIKLYNKHIPSKEQQLMCDYVIFGHYDGIAVGDNIFNEKASIMDMWKYALENVDLSGQKRNFSQQILYAMRYDENGWKKDFEFWEDKEKPFLFLCIMQIGHVNNLTQCKKAIEERIETHFKELYREKGRVAVMCYSSFENNGLILAIKCSHYYYGADIINSLHEPNAKIFYKEDNNEFSVEIKYTYTLHGIKSDYSYLEVMDDDSITKEIHLYAIEKQPGSVREIYNKIKRDIGEGASIKRRLIAGNDDECLLLDKVPWKTFLSFYLGNNQDGFLTGANSDFHKATHSIATHFMSVPSKVEYFVCDRNILDKEKHSDKGQEEGNEGRQNVSICDRISIYLENIKKSMDASSAQIGMESKRATYYKAMSQILNSLQKFEIALNESSSFDDYTYFMIYQPLSLLAQAIECASLIENSGENVDEFLPTERIFRFLNGVTLIAQNSMHSDRQFVQVPDFNAIVYESPVKLNAYYGAFIKKAQRMLNKLDGVEYGFLIVPGLNEYMAVRDIFHRLIENKRLFTIEIPERQIYDPNNIMPALLHEIAHKVGRELRCREERYDAIKNMAVYLVAEDILKFMDMEGYRHSREVEELFQLIDSSLSVILHKVRKEENDDYNKKIFKYNAIMDKFNKDYRLPVRNDYISYNMYNDIFRAIRKAINELINAEKLQERLWGMYYKGHINQGKKYDSLDSFLESLQSNIARYLTVTEYSGILEDKGNTNKESDNEEEHIIKNYWKFGLYPELRDIFWVFSEVYADIISIITLRLNMREYISVIQSNNLKSNQEEICTSIMAVRIALVLEIMIKGRGLEIDTWKVGDLKELEQGSEHHVLAKEVGKILMAYEMGKDLCMEVVPKILLTPKGRDIVLEYINKCIEKYRENILDMEEEQGKQRDELYEMYRAVCDLETVGIEEVIQNIEDKIVEYQDCVKEELSLK